MTYELYLKIPKPMIEWKFIMMLAKNPEFINKLRDTSHPLIRKYRRIIENRDI